MRKRERKEREGWAEAGWLGLTAAIINLREEGKGRGRKSEEKRQDLKLTYKLCLLAKVSLASDTFCLFFLGSFLCLFFVGEA